jgi:hypothetical protein
VSAWLFSTTVLRVLARKANEAAQNGNGTVARRLMQVALDEDPDEMNLLRSCDSRGVPLGEGAAIAREVRAAMSEKRGASP